MELRTAVATLFDSPSREFSVELWDGDVLPYRCGAGAPGHVVLREPGVLARLTPPVDERRIARAFIEGEIEIVGDTIGVLEAISRWEGPRRPLLAWSVAAPAIARALLSPVLSAHVRRRHSVGRDARSVRLHYDLSDDFYRLFLDRGLVYSCAYFARGDESIDEAQQAKIELSCRKLGLREGERLLDVGCGWGALLVHAAERFGVHAVGTTLSRNQASEARRRAAASHAATRVQVLERDYRKLPDDPVDKIVSIGMMEHVGAEFLDGYFGRLYRKLTPGGWMLNHAIADISPSERTVPWLRRSSGGFIARDIFPDSELPPLGAVVAAAERQGFEVRDVESLREHYERTLTCWLTRLEGRFDDALVVVGPQTARAWRLYLAASAVAFRTGRIGVYQVLLARRTSDGRTLGYPRSRASWYEPRSTPPALPAVVSA